MDIVEMDEIQSHDFKFNGNVYQIKVYMKGNTYKLKSFLDNNDANCIVHEINLTGINSADWYWGHSDDPCTYLVNISKNDIQNLFGILK